jgi:hypothetical protein
MTDLKPLHDRASAIAATSQHRLCSVTAGELAELVQQTAGKLPKADAEGASQILDTHAALSAASQNAPQTVCRVAAAAVLSLTTLLFGTPITTSKKEPGKPANPAT